MPMRYEHDHENDVIYFGKTNFRNAMRKFGIKTDDRRRHMYVIGKTGMGKTTLLENMILADIYAGHGCCYIDPHGDTAEKLLDYIPSWRINDVVYFNPADTKFPIGFNILEKTESAAHIDDYNNKVMSGLMSTFKKVWENVWSARMEYILQNTILALLDTPGSTLLGVNRMLSDKDYRTSIIQNIQDPVVQQFWLKEFAQYDAKFASEAVAPIQNKIGQLLTSTIMRNIVAQAKSSINFREIMDDQKILIINLSKGLVGEDVMRILGGMLVTKIYMSAMERVSIKDERERQDFYLYVDEFQNFAVESFASILSEARKYRLNLIIAHQYIAQIEQKESTAVRDAVFGNIGSMIMFRVGAPDAEFLESELMPRFMPEDLINLPKYGIYLKLMIDGVTSQPFSAETLPPIAQRTGTTEKIIEQSRERYGGNRKMIEEHVMVWSGFDPNVNVADALKKVADEKKEDKKKRYSHEYDCTRCGKKFLLPVELDRSRPIYCEECHPIVMEERKKGKDKKEERKSTSGAKSAPKLNEGELISREIGSAVGLDVLAPSVAPEKPATTATIVAPKPVINEHRASDMLSLPDASSVSGMTGGAEHGSVDVGKRKRKRRRRNRGGDKPTVGTATTGNSTTPPRTVIPGERISFDDHV